MLNKEIMVGFVFISLMSSCILWLSYFINLSSEIELISNTIVISAVLFFGLLAFKRKILLSKFPYVEPNLMYGESLLLYGSCYELVKGKKIPIHLTLTNKRIIFQYKDVYCDYALPGELYRVSLKKYLNFFNYGLIFYFENQKREVLIEFASDWKEVIEQRFIAVGIK